ncbi:hypothetical protein [Bremerella sp. P1]|uniref:hypothetical protein n=1 Tax=Bremerella sp. P1 TaxID=3026424 RepID=UPI00236830E0|nr:hypothetical protein [Bremerella sp. P1]WDI43810.1 hypothetical protein PSR63_07595 [Bremerella sp. P1]
MDHDLSDASANPCLSPHSDENLGRPWLYEVLLPILVTGLGAALLAFASPRIDFHADEAIYMSAVPVSTQRDSGLVFHLAYLAGSLGAPTPLAARCTSLAFGCLLIFSVTRTLQRLLPDRSAILAILVPLSIVISYQGVFTILRVRPEISWLAMSSLACWCLAELRVKKTRTFQALLLLALLALPMNHLLSLFPCFFLVIYLTAFGRNYLGNRFTVLSLGMLGAGYLLNQVLRAWWIGATIQLLPNVGGASQPRPSIGSFLGHVYWHTPLALADRAATSSLWDYLIPVENPAMVSHCMIATLIWAIVLPLPLLMRSWESRFVTSIPLITLVLFYLSGYFNPTYAPILTLYTIAIYCALALDSKSLRFHKFVAVTILGVTLINGTSFLATRVLNHGPASFYQVEAALREKMATLPEDAVIAIPERFQSALGREQQRVVMFKHPLPDQVDLFVLDNYDFEMYRFVPTYEERRNEVLEFLSRHTPSDEFSMPVYRNEKLDNATENNVAIKTALGSWFFRNSMTYTVSIIGQHEQDQYRISQMLDDPATSSSRH